MEKKNKFLIIFKENIVYIIILITIILVRIFIVSPVRVDGKSMNNTLFNNDILLLKKFDKSYDRFDVVVFKYKNMKLVKRVIGLPGEHIKYKDNVLYVNDKAIDEDMIEIKTSNFDLSQLGFEVIPNDYYFVVGDNRINSQDSRYIGLIPKSDILGTADFVIFPINHFGKFK